MSSFNEFGIIKLDIEKRNIYPQGWMDLSLDHTQIQGNNFAELKLVNPKIKRENYKLLHAENLKLGLANLRTSGVDYFKQMFVVDEKTLVVVQ